MTERERVAEIVQAACVCSTGEPCMICKDQIERIHAIYTEGLEPVAWEVSCSVGGDRYVEHWSNVRRGRAEAQAAEWTERGDRDVRIVPLFTHPPRSEAEARLRKALEELGRADGTDYMKRAMQREGATRHDAELWGAIYCDGLAAARRIMLRALSDTGDG